MVLSERGKRRPDEHVGRWFRTVGDDQLLTSVIVFGEIAAGIAKKRATDPAFADRLAEWSEATRLEFLDRTLPVTTAVALRWGELSIVLKRRDLDLLIAATALEHDLTVVTRNVRHFEPTGVKLLNPYEA